MAGFSPIFLGTICAKPEALQGFPRPRIDMHILALTRYERLGSSSRVRFYQYFPYLKAQGVEILSKPFFSDDYVRNLYAGRAASLKDVFWAYIRRLAVLARSSSFDLLWLEKELLPLLPAGFEALLRLFKIPY